MAIALRFANKSIRFSASVANCMHALFTAPQERKCLLSAFNLDEAITSHTTRSSKALVEAESCLAHETLATVIPQLWQLTLGAKAINLVVVKPISI